MGPNQGARKDGTGDRNNEGRSLSDGSSLSIHQDALLEGVLALVRELGAGEWSRVSEGQTAGGFRCLFSGIQAGESGIEIAVHHDGSIDIVHEPVWIPDVGLVKQIHSIPISEKGKMIHSQIGFDQMEFQSQSGRVSIVSRIKREITEIFGDRREGYKTEVMVPIEQVERGELESVLADEYRIFKNDDGAIQFGGLGPCLGILIRFEDLEVTLAAHLPSPESYDELKLDRIISDAKLLSGRLEEAKVTLAGLEPFVEARSTAVANKTREIIIEKLQSLGIKPMNILAEWGSGEETVDVVLELKTGEIEVSHDQD